MNFLKNNWLTIVLALGLVFYVWRNNALNYALTMSESKSQKEFIISHLKDLDNKLKDLDVKTKADSIQRHEVLKTLPKYENNLSISRLKFIRDSLREVSRHAVLNR